jgi:hypothetical protein
MQQKPRFQILQPPAVQFYLHLLSPCLRRLPLLPPGLEHRKILWFRRGSTLVLFHDLGINFPAVNFRFSRRLDAELDLVALQGNDGNADAIINRNTLSQLPCQD